MYIDHNVLLSGDYISAFRGCCPFTFLHTLWPRLDSAHHNWERGPPKHFYSWKFKIWLIMQRLSPDNFGASKNILTKLFKATWWTHPKCSWTVIWRSPYATCFFSESFELRGGILVCAVMRRFKTKVGIWHHRRNAAILARRANVEGAMRYSDCQTGDA